MQQLDSLGNGCISGCPVLIWPLLSMSLHHVQAVTCTAVTKDVSCSPEGFRSDQALSNVVPSFLLHFCGHAQFADAARGDMLPLGHHLLSIAAMDTLSASPSEF